jgi:hypothetical protein
LQKRIFCFILDLTRREELEIESDSEKGHDFEIDHNVYILGAGFSKAAGLPLMDDFLTSMKEVLQILINDGNPLTNYSKALHQILKFRKELSSCGYFIQVDLDNIEDLLSIINSC